jgi:predicted TIM-barrel fold metal-dependent hydrolase
MIITDSHAHLYSTDEARYPMAPHPLRPPVGYGSVEHLKREMAANGVGRVVAIQTGSAYAWDNRLLADSARANAPWMVGVCTLDPDNPASPGLLRELVRESNVRGLRSVRSGGQGSYDSGTQLDHPGVEALWRAADELGIVVNALIHVEQADALERLLKRHRDLRVVLDHCMYPRGREGLQGETMQRVLRLAGHPNLHAKLTWLVDTSDQEYPFADTQPLLRAVVKAYGAERCVWGSDFPCELWTPKATYTQAFTLFTQALGLSAAEQEAILSTTPGRLWFGEA